MCKAFAIRLVDGKLEGFTPEISTWPGQHPHLAVNHHCHLDDSVRGSIPRLMASLAPGHGNNPTDNWRYELCFYSTSETWDECLSSLYESLIHGPSYPPGIVGHLPWVVVQLNRFFNLFPENELARAVRYQQILLDRTSELQPYRHSIRQLQGVQNADYGFENRVAPRRILLECDASGSYHQSYQPGTSTGVAAPVKTLHHPFSQSLFDFELNDCRSFNVMYREGSLKDLSSEVGHSRFQNLNDATYGSAAVRCVFNLDDVRSCLLSKGSLGLARLFAKKGFRVGCPTQLITLWIHEDQHISDHVFLEVLWKKLQHQLQSRGRSELFTFLPDRLGEWFEMEKDGALACPSGFWNVSWRELRKSTHAQFSVFFGGAGNGNLVLPSAITKTLGSTDPGIHWEVPHPIGDHGDIDSSGDADDVFRNHSVHEVSFCVRELWTTILTGGCLFGFISQRLSRSGLLEDTAAKLTFFAHTRSAEGMRDLYNLHSRLIINAQKWHPGSRARRISSMAGRVITEYYKDEYKRGRGMRVVTTSVASGQHSHSSPRPEDSTTCAECHILRPQTKAQGKEPATRAGPPPRHDSIAAQRETTVTHYAALYVDMPRSMPAPRRPQDSMLPIGSQPRLCLGCGSRFPSLSDIYRHFTTCRRTYKEDIDDLDQFYHGPSSV